MLIFILFLLPASAAVLESVGTYKVTIIRHGRMDHTVKVRVETIDGSANEGEDYLPVNEVLTFEPNEREKEVGIVLIIILLVCYWLIAIN